MKKLVCLLLLMFILVASFSACDLFKPEQNDPSQGNQGGTSETPDTPDPDSDVDISVDIKVVTEGGMKMDSLTVYVYEFIKGELGEILANATTDSEGKVSFELTGAPAYVAKVDTMLPEGYLCEEYYLLSEGENEIVITSSVIPNSDLTNVSYQLGDIIRDFTVQTVDGESITLSRLLETKKAVLLNFWFVDCPWCVIEFPMVDLAASEYADDIAVLAINPGIDSPDSIKQFREAEGLSLDFVSTDRSLANAFGLRGYPSSILIDSYGTISFIEQGVILGMRELRSLFSYYSAPDYTQRLTSDISEVTPPQTDSFVFPEGMTEIPAYEFSSYTNIETLVIPDGVTHIGTGAFQNCPNLKSVYIPDSVSSIDKNTFLNCSELTEVRLPASITAIPDNMFQYCTLLGGIEIPSGVTSIGDYAFFSCENISSFELPAGVEYIGDCAFGYCTMESFTIPSAVNYIGEAAFIGCEKLKSIAIPEGITLLGEALFYECLSLSEISLPSTLVSILDFAISGCTALKNISLPEGLVSIGYGAFSGSGLESVVIPDSVTTVAEGGFAECLSLKTITFGSGLVNIKSSSFSTCIALEAINVSESNPRFMSIDGNVYSKDGKSLYLYAIGKSEETFVIPEGVVTVFAQSLARAKNLKAIVIPTSVKNISTAATYLCDGLTDVYYRGTAEQWALVSVAEGNDPVVNATKHFDYID